MKNPPFPLMITVSLNLVYSSYSRVHLFLSLSFFCTDKVEVVIEVSGIFRMLKKPGGGENTHSVLEVFLCANVHFKAKPSKVVGNEGDPFFDVGPGFKNKCTIIYVKNVE